MDRRRLMWIRSNIGAWLIFGWLTVLVFQRVVETLSAEVLDRATTLELTRDLFLLLFLVLTLYAYVIRDLPKEKARGWLQHAFPLFIAFAVPIGFMVATPPPEQVPGPWAFAVGIGLSLVGWTLAIYSLWYLRRSFSVTAEVRDLVTSGPYRYLRHPLYLAEMIIWAGLATMLGTLLGWVVFLAATILQAYRAVIEERKLSGRLAEYTIYRQRTGFLWPASSERRLREEARPVSSGDGGHRGDLQSSPSNQQASL